MLLTARSWLMAGVDYDKAKLGQDSQDVSG
jgi:hypothetical protein